MERPTVAIHVVPGIQFSVASGASARRCSRRRTQNPGATVQSKPRQAPPLVARVAAAVVRVFRYISSMSAAQPANRLWTVARLLAWTKEYFDRHRVESARLCAEILLAHALGCKRLELYTQHESVPSDAQLASFRAAVTEVAKGKPVAYVTGTKDFFSLTFEVTPDVLVPRPETE